MLCSQHKSKREISKQGLMQSANYHQNPNFKPSDSITFFPKQNSLLINFNKPYANNEYQIFAKQKCQYRKIENTNNSKSSSLIKYVEKNKQSEMDYQHILKMSLKCGHYWPQNQVEKCKQVKLPKQLGNCGQYGLNFDRKKNRKHHQHKNTQETQQKSIKNICKHRSYSLSNISNRDIHNKEKYYNLQNQPNIQHYMILPARKKYSEFPRSERYGQKQKIYNYGSIYPNNYSKSRKKYKKRSVSVYTQTKDLDSWASLNSCSKETKIQTQTAISSDNISSQRSSRHRERSSSMSFQQIGNKFKDTCLTQENIAQQVQYLRSLTLKLYEQKQIIQQKLKKYMLDENKNKYHINKNQ